MIKSFLLVILAMLCVMVAFAQYPSRYFIQFTDKNSNGYSITNPSAFLSARAIARRSKQNIGYDLNDLPVTQNYVDSLAAKGAIILNKTKWLNGVTIETTDPSVLNAIHALPFVINTNIPVGRVAKPAHSKDSIPANFLQREEILNTPANNIPQRMESQQRINYGYGFNQIHMINGDFLHANGFMGEGILIAVLDAGFYHADTMQGFDSLRNNNLIIGTKNFVQTISNNVYTDHYHGTMVLSLMGGNEPGMLVGTAPHASYFLIITEDADHENIIEEYNWASGAEFADSLGADIITTSLGYTTFDHADQDHTYLDMDGKTTPCAKAAKIAATKGILVCAAAGNDGNNSSWNHIGTPADADSIITVGAVDKASVYAAFSSVGPSADGRIKPDVATQGQGTTVMDPLGWGKNGLITNGNGTSFATPILAGAAACLWQANPSKTNMEIRQAIIASASQYGMPDAKLGYGIPNFANAMYLLNHSDINAENEDITLFPNPFERTIFFKFNATTDQNITIQLMDATGKVLLRETRAVIGGKTEMISVPALNNNVMESPVLQNGIYILQVQTNTHLFTKKIVKI